MSSHAHRRPETTLSAPETSMRLTRRSSDISQMPVMAHLRELRRRLTISAVGTAAAAVAAWFAYSRLFAFIEAPMRIALSKSHRADVMLSMAGVAEPFTLQMQVCAVAGLICASPVWLFQLWRFVAPGLHRHERRRAWWFVSAAVPLFLCGVWLAYRVMPQAIALLIGFTPAGVANIIPVATYVSFICRMVLVFGAAFLLPIVFIALNLAGLLPASTLRGWWRQIIVGSLIFAAVATPTGDPINMLILAAPMLVVSFVAMGVCSVVDVRRARAVGREQLHSAT